MGRRRWRIAHVLPSARSGGVETFVLTVVRTLDRRRFGMNVSILGADGPIASALRDAGADVFCLGAGPRLGPGDYARLVSHWKTRVPDLLHVNCGGYLLRRTARIAGARNIISQVHAPLENWVEPLRRGETSIAAVLRRAYVAASDLVVFPSEVLRRQFEFACGPSPPLNSCVLCPGIDLSQFPPRTADSRARARRGLGIRENTRVVGFVGRLAPQKGIAFLLTTIEKLASSRADVEFVIVGEGPLRSAVTALAARNPRVRWAGERFDVPSIMPAFDIVAVPSAWEPLGIVLLEAMASEVPPVAFAVDGIPEAVEDGITGLLVAPGDPDGFLAAISRLLNDGGLRTRVGIAGRLRVQQHFSAPTMARRLGEIYSGLLNDEG